MGVARILVIAVTALAVTTAGCASEEGSPGDRIEEGRVAFESTCAACHGLDLKGTGSGPSFLDPIYAPDHHGDEAFYRAAANGVVPHHWNFGPMPPQTGVSKEDIEAIIAYVRSRQREEGIGTSPSPR